MAAHAAISMVNVDRRRTAPNAAVRVASSGGQSEPHSPWCDLTQGRDTCDSPGLEHRMRVRGEIVFPNNLRELRRKRRLTQAQLGRLLKPPVGESTISKMESGERRLSNLQLANLATVLGCRPEEIPVVPHRDPSPGVQRWQKTQQEAIRHSIESGAAATSYVLAQLRKRSGNTMQQLASAIGMTLSVYHRVEMASRVLQADELDAIAKYYGLSTSKLIGMIERRTRDNLQQLTNLGASSLTKSAIVGRKSAAHSASLKARAYSRHAGLSPQSGSRRNLLLNGQPARPPLGSVGDADRHIARRGSPGARPRTLPHRRLGCPSRSYALSVDLAVRRCRLPRSVARDQNRLCEVFSLPASRDHE
jgi:transcriptional regulator with XRE-family HTH domain